MNIIVLATTEAAYPSLGGTIYQFHAGREYDVPDGFAHAALAAGWADAATTTTVESIEAESKKKAKRGGG